MFNAASLHAALKKGRCADVTAAATKKKVEGRETAHDRLSKCAF